MVQPYRTQSLSLKWDQLSRLLPQRWRPLTRTHQQLKEVHQPRWFLTHREPLCLRLPLTLSPLYSRQPQVQRGDQGELLIKRHTDNQGCSGTVFTKTALASHNKSNLLFLFIRHGERRGFQIIHGGFIILFINFQSFLISCLTDLSACNDVSIILQGYIEEENSKFFHS